ncbi:prepilin-type N-terminal cleavage/methylation domain-containing protein [Bdellovibrio sp. 22V]|uniref:PilW family protein n=1 Tax=Bdellovibrio TaxID=958 RepID=UPI002542CD9E|nr:prepilin-type N-terminal cleavage/methylation domain-containing protein [Bdellovibrio sp. 22V]WII71983.1 prepilin-type N-terminal cleavage/methylation domain-containing protein [Bdellovibrio sp. 22V]
MMESFGKNRKGMTLVEVLVALSISMVTVGVFLYLALGNRTHKSQQDHSNLLKELLLNNVIELKGMPYTALPPAETCIIRTYDYLGNFQTETQSVSSDDYCDVASPGNGEIQVLWKIKNAANSDVSFSISGMKLPTHANFLKKVTLHARTLTKSSTPTPLHNHITIFKR